MFTEKKDHIAVVVPTIRTEQLEKFLNSWFDLFKKHGVQLVVVRDGDKPKVNHWDYSMMRGSKIVTLKEIMGRKNQDLIFNKNDGVRNLGFAYVAKYLPDVEYIISLDDDVRPSGDTIDDHVKALKTGGSLDWVTTMNGLSPRGFPYEEKGKHPVMLSHGVWHGVPDVDAATQLTMIKNESFSFPFVAIPRGAYFPLCAMNFAFKREALPYVYQAPMGIMGLDRFADIWAGISLKREFDKKNWVVITGFAKVFHERASNKYKNLQKESVGLELNESFWKGDESHPYFKVYNKAKADWKKFIEETEKGRFGILTTTL